MSMTSGGIVGRSPDPDSGVIMPRASLDPDGLMVLYGEEVELTYPVQYFKTIER